MNNSTAPAKPISKRELLANIAGATDLSKKQVAAMLDALAAEIKRSLGNGGAGVIVIPGLVKIEKKMFQPRPAQQGAPNPFKPGEVRDISSKPAYFKVKVRTLKPLREMARH